MLRTNIPLYLTKRFRSGFDIKNALTTPLSKPLKKFQSNEFKNKSVDDVELFDAKITKLSNGLTVATEKSYGTFSTIGVAINSGCRYETNYMKGLTHVLQKLAFGSSENYPSTSMTQSFLLKSGALLDCQSTRDCFLYASSCFNSSQEDILSIISDTLFRPLILDDELQNAIDICLLELQQMYRNPDPEPLLMDWLHKAAYKSKTLGISKFLDKNNAKKMTKNDILKYMARYHSPSNMVVAGVGVDHDHFVEMVQKHFVDKKPIWISNKEDFSFDDTSICDDTPAEYVGGSVHQIGDLSNKGLSIVDFPELAHFVLAFEGVSFKDKDFVTCCVMQYILGGGKSFSAGGPGKGMYTRLYMDVLRHNPTMYNAQAFNHSYSDSGIFCIHIGNDPDYSGNSVDYAIFEFLKLTIPIPDDELNRAKQLLKSQLLMNLEQKPVMFEDLARQVLGHGKRKSPMEYIKEIEAVTSDDIRRVAEKMLSGVPTVVMYGNNRMMHKYDAICNQIKAGNLQMDRFK
ncbi:Mitochondrial-processing peptidase subunit alpha [Strongyloides ratti]|uniref:Mitochondrial-processing peptidase subunit alpha n=1 Tax=Strongyloides ratti TaxID=34506 RepID=A0A090L5N1_STRRB|nr:Mitochondrial-processing peptidase subunit alpha [Strongyloides ratti]CEF62784.1 Mitochondrial-processing peptidase subunit alpha [Strongyloides ratti]